MKRHIVILALLSGACGGPDVTGNSQGGIMKWSSGNEREAFRAAQNHCTRYGKDAKITQIVPTAGGSVTFECVKS
jgi:hypothetical protein